MKLKKLTNTTHGFTIVELLIVIVIIGILTAVIIVTYSSAQQRANNNQTMTAVRQYIHGITAYAQDNNEYPYYNASGSNGNCIGVDYSGGKCIYVGGVSPPHLGSMSVQTVFNDKIKPYMNNKLPTPSTQIIDWDGAYTGAYYSLNRTTLPPNPPTITYFLSGSSLACSGLGIVLISTSSTGNGKACIVQFPTL